MNPNPRVVYRPAESALATNKVLRNTYALLSMTLLFSALMAGVAMAVNAAPLPWFITLAGFFGLFFLTAKLSNSAWGLAAVFALTGFMGYTLGPILNFYLSLPNGPQIVMTAMGGTGAIFLALSGYVLVTRKDFSFIGGFLGVGILVVFLAMLGNLFFQIPALSLALSSAVILLMAGFILYDTSRILHGGETNYIMATVALFVDIYNLFVNLLAILGIFGSED
ncbi:MAG: Bax inhibitor-1/YccA family protein [Pseudomonadota bacterium]|nr:Bax inhibitor-1/YccA family protein [Pseudomonadota bacterium]